MGSILGDLVAPDVKGRTVGKASVQNRHFAEHRFHELADGHTRGDRMGVDNEVGAHAGCGGGHVALVQDQAHRSFLPRPPGQLVA